MNVSQWLSNSDETFDLIIACDTFIYFGDLSAVLRLVTKQLTPDGCVAFSVENAASGSHQLNDNGRYAHHRSHISDSAHSAGLRICCQRQDFIRMEYGQRVEASYYCLSKPLVDNREPVHQ